MVVVLNKFAQMDYFYSKTLFHQIYDSLLKQVLTVTLIYDK